MAFKITKAELARRDALADRLRAAKDVVEDEVSAFNADRADRLLIVDAAVIAYNAVLEEARQFVEDIATDQRGAYDDMSEKWQEGERAPAVDEWVGEFENAELSDIELEPLDDLATPDMEHDETLTALRAGPDE